MLRSIVVIAATAATLSLASSSLAATPDLRVTADVISNDTTNATVAFTVTNTGADPAAAVQLYALAHQAVTATSVTATGGSCHVDYPSIVFAANGPAEPEARCELGDLAAGASTQVTVALDDRSVNGDASLFPPNFRGVGTIEARVGDATTIATFRFTRPRVRFGLWGVHFAEGARVAQLRYTVPRAADVTVTVLSLRTGHHVATFTRRPLRGANAVSLRDGAGHLLAPGRYRATIRASATGIARPGYSPATPRRITFTIPPT